MPSSPSFIVFLSLFGGGVIRFIQASSFTSPVFDGVVSRACAAVGDDTGFWANQLRALKTKCVCGEVMRGVLKTSCTR